VAEDEAMRDQAEAMLAEARGRAQAAQSQGQPYSSALHLTIAAQALVLLDRPDEALADIESALTYVAMLRDDGQHEHMRLLHISSPSLPRPTEELGDLDALEAWARVGRAAALTRMGRWSDARVAVDEARPWVKGFSRRQLRRNLDAVADEIARSDGAGVEAIDALDRTLSDQALPDADRRVARYERAAHLVDDGRYDEATHEALIVIRDAEDDPALTARARQVLGAALAARGLDDEADASLQAAFDGFRQTEDHAAVLRAAPGLAWRLTERGRCAEAVAVLDQAMPSARALNDRGSESDLLAARGTAYDLAGDTELSIASFTEAATVAESLSDAVRAADARHGEAVVRARSGIPHDAVEALSLLDAAAAAYTTASLPERAAECAHESAALLARLGSFDAARQRYGTARESYLAIPEILRADDPGAVDDCDYNLRIIDSIIAGETHPTAVPPDAFGSGGHHMQHSRENASR
jgi:tetratricopeptide (TPR) repeat protein